MTQTSSSRMPCARPRAALISVVLPVYNEVAVLTSLVEQVSAALASATSRYEIIFVNDGSCDGSGPALDALAAADSCVRVLHFSRNFGHQAAVQAGLAHAGGDAVVLMDSDLQDTPAAIPAFVAAWREGYDVVYAVRRQRKEGLIKRGLFAAFHRFLAAIAVPPVPADAGIFGLVDREVARQIEGLPERDRYFPGLRSWVGFRQKGIEVERQARYDDHPRVSLRGLVRLAKTAVFSFSRFPLRFFYGIGLVAGLTFFALSVFALACRMLTDLAVPGWTSHVLIGSFFGALNAMGICMLGEYVVRIYDQVRARPLYLIERAVNFPSDAGDAADEAFRPECEDETYLHLLEQVTELQVGEEETADREQGARA